jgi:ribose transport system ATP-binding protein
MSEPFLLVMKNIKKSFPGVQAVDNVTLEILPGEIHALVGENGAGKSTLVRVLSGATTPDSGFIYWHEDEVHINSPAISQALGISMIHQELAVIPYLDAGKNIYLGREPRGFLPGQIKWSKLYQDAEEQLSRLGLHFDPRTPVNSLTIAQKQMVEVSRALSIDAELIVMDEPTSALTERESEALFTQMGRLKEHGVSIIFISHRLEEVFRVADRITVMRDGKHIGTHPIDEVNKNDVINMMVGRDLTYEATSQPKSPSGDIILETIDVYGEDHVHGVSIQLRKGEILGLSGLVGAGRTALAEMIFGVHSIKSGEINFKGQKVKFKNPSEAIALGMGFVPEDRKGKGLFLNMGVRHNIAIAVLKDLTRYGFVNKKAIQLMVKKLIDSLEIKTTGLSQRVRNLSGGNQQKVVISRWLALEPDFLILDEPTRGIDVGAKAEIHTLLRKMADNGVSILMISSELPEILSVSDRILVMRDGMIVAEFEPSTTTQDVIMHAAAWSENGNNGKES